MPGVADADPAEKFRLRQLLPPRHEWQPHSLLHQLVLQNAEAGQRRPVPGVTGIINFDAVQTLRNAGQDFRGRRVGRREFFVGQQQKRFGAAAKKNIDADAVRFGCEFGLHEAQRVGGAADVAPFDGDAFAEMFAMPLIEAAGELVANGLVVRRDDDDAVFSAYSDWPANRDESQRAKKNKSLLKYPTENGMAPKSGYHAAPV